MEKVRLTFDSLLIALYIIPTILLLLLSMFCSGWNEGSGSGTCSPIFLESLYEGFYNFFFTPTLPAAIIGVIYMFVIPAIFLGSFGFRLMSLSEGLIAMRKDWFGFVVVGLVILIFIVSI